MGAIVFASAGGRKYHFDKGCKAFEFGQQLNDWDTPDDAYLASWNYPRLHGLRRMSATKAAMDGKLPCLACVPRHLREMPEADDFGHWPTRGISLNSLADDVCQRCTEPGVFYERGVDELTPVHIIWPCTSAVVLGLAPREEVTA